MTRWCNTRVHTGEGAPCPKRIPMNGVPRILPWAGWLADSQGGNVVVSIEDRGNDACGSRQRVIDPESAEFSTLEGPSSAPCRGIAGIRRRTVP